MENRQEEITPKAMPGEKEMGSGEEGWRDIRKRGRGGVSNVRSAGLCGRREGRAGQGLQCNGRTLSELMTEARFLEAQQVSSRISRRVRQRPSKTANTRREEKIAHVGERPRTFRQHG